MIIIQFYLNCAIKFYKYEKQNYFITQNKLFNALYILLHNTQNIFLKTKYLKTFCLLGMQ